MPFRLLIRHGKGDLTKKVISNSPYNEEMYITKLRHRLHKIQVFPLMKLKAHNKL